MQSSILLRSRGALRLLALTGISVSGCGGADEPATVDVSAAVVSEPSVAEGGLTGAGAKDDATREPARWDVAVDAFPPPPPSPFSGRAPDPERSWDEYAFAILGHTRGGPEGPSPNERVRRHAYRMAHADFIVGLGDLYYSISPDRVAEFREWAGREGVPPLYNAVGNHDLQIGGERLADGSLEKCSYDSRVYADEFGPTYDAFRVGGELFIFIEVLMTPEQVLDAEQLAWVEAVVDRAAADETIENVFVAMHKVIWSYHNPETAPLFKYRHQVPVPDGYTWYSEQLEPILERLPPAVDLFLLAGDIGGGPKYLQVYYHRSGRTTYVATGMGAASRDGFVDVRVTADGIEMDYVTYVDGGRAPVETFGNDFWLAFYAEHPDLAAKAVFPRLEQD